MKKQSFQQKCMVLFSNLKKLSVLVVIVLVLISLITCTKKDDPEPTPPKSLDKTVVNTITEQQATLTNIAGNKNESKNIARYKGIALKGEATSNFEKKDPNNTVYEVKEHATYPKDSLTVVFKEKGSGVIVQKVISPTLSNQKEDFNKDGVLDNVNYTGLTKTVESNVMVNLPVETATNAITVAETPELTLEGAIGEIKFIKKFAGNAEQGELEYSFDIEGMSDVVEVTEVEKNGEKMLQVRFLKTGTLIIKQQLSSSEVLVNVDDDNDGLVDRILQLTAEMVAAETAVEAKDIEFGVNTAKVAEIQAELFDKKITQGETLIIDMKDIINLPSGVSPNQMSTVPTIIPQGAFEGKWLEDSNWELSMDYDYRGSDPIKIKLKTYLNEEVVTTEFTVTHGVSLDVSNPTQVQESIRNYFADLYLENVNGVPFDDSERPYHLDNKEDMKLYIHGGEDAEVKDLIMKAIADLDYNFQQAGTVKEDGSPYRAMIVENESEANFHAFFGSGSGAAWESLYPSGEPGNIIGLSSKIFEDNNVATRTVIGGGAYTRIDRVQSDGSLEAMTAEAQVSTIMQELLQVTGSSGEFNDNRTSITSGGGESIYMNWLDAAAFRIYNSPEIKTKMTIAEIKALYPPIIQRITQQIIDEINAQ